MYSLCHTLPPPCLATQSCYYTVRGLSTGFEGHRVLDKQWTVVSCAEQTARKLRSEYEDHVVSVMTEQTSIPR